VHQFILWWHSYPVKDEAVISELVREPDGEEATGVELVSNVSKMLAKNSEKASKKADFEYEPRRTRTSNRLIKRLFFQTDK
jgi:hypothetical protein